MVRDASDSPKAAGKRSAKAEGKMRTRMALLQRGAETREEPPVKKAKGEETDDAMMDES